MIGAVELTSEAGITYRQLHYWVRKGYVFPENRDEADGSGVSFEFSDHEAAIVRLMGLMCEHGHRPAEASWVARTAVDNKSVEVRIRDGFWVHLPTEMVHYGKKFKNRVDTV
jgi:hypothetical protein